MRRVLLVLLLAAGCGDGDDVIPTPDAGPLVDRSMCVPGSLAGFAPSGIWHADIDVPGFAPFPYALNFDTDPILLNGIQAQLVSPDADDVVIHLAYTLSNGSTRDRTVDFCARDADGALRGPVSFCRDAKCYPGSTRAVKVERLAGETDTHGLELVSEWEGDGWPDEITVNVRVSAGLAYLARYTDGLRIVDVHDPVHPRDLGHAAVTFDDGSEIYNDVKIVTDEASGKVFALMASNLRGVVAYDVSDPGAPVEVSTFPKPGPQQDYVNVHTLFVEGTMAYVANVSTGGVEFWDISDPTHPVSRGGFVHELVATDPDAFVHDLFVAGAHVYLAYWNAGLVILDAGDPENPVSVGEYRDYERRTTHSVWADRGIAVIGDEDYGAHVRVLDVDPASPAYMTKIGELQLRPEVSVHNIQVIGDKAYVAWYQDGLRVLDLADPTHPTVEAYANTWDGRSGFSFYESGIGVDAYPTDGIIYLADTERGLVIFHIPQSTP